MKVLSIACALAALFIVASAFPQVPPNLPPGGPPPGGPPKAGPASDEGETDPEEGGAEGEEMTTTPDPCKDFEEQCTSNEDAMAPGHDSGDAASNGTVGNTTPNPHCEHLQQRCSSQNNSTLPGGVQTRPTSPQPMTQPGSEVPTQPANPSLPTTMAPVPTTPAVPNAGRRR